MSPKADVSAERIQQIYQAALACFNRKGYYQTTMDDIVAESGLSKGALYWYFDSKKTLFISLLQDFMEPLGMEWQAIAGDSRLTAREKLLAYLEIFRAQFEEMVNFFGLVMEAWAQTHFDEDVQKISQELYKPYRIYLKQVLDEGVERGEFEIVDTWAMTAVILTMYDGLTLAVGGGMLDDDPAVLIDTAVDLVLRGLGVEGN